MTKFIYLISLFGRDSAGNIVERGLDEEPCSLKEAERLARFTLEWEPTYFMARIERHLRWEGPEYAKPVKEIHRK